MRRILYPYEWAESVFSIDYEKLYALGLRGIVFDIDNTLVPHGKDSTPEVDQLFRDLGAMGFKTLVLSNNSEERVLRFLANIDAPYVCNAEKPDPAGFLRAVELLGLPGEQVVFIGDTLFTDVVGANRCGFVSILVQYIKKPGERRIGIRRRLEKLVLWCYRHSRYQRRLGGVEKEA